MSATPVPPGSSGPPTPSGGTPTGKLRRRRSDRVRPWIQEIRLRVRRQLSEPKSPLWGAALLVVLSVLCALLLLGERASTPLFRAGSIAPATVWAQKTYRLTDEGLTQARRQDAVRTVRSVYDYDPLALSAAVTRLDGAFQAAREKPARGEPEARGKAFAEAAGIPSAPALTELARDHFDSGLERISRTLLESLQGERVVVRADLLSADLESGIAEREVVAGQVKTEERVVKGGEAVVDLDAARALLADTAQRTTAHEPATRRELAVAIASLAVRPNLTYNAAETEARRERARDSVSDVTLTVPKGKAVVEAGHEVTEEQARLLQSMREADGMPASGLPLAALGLFLLSGSILGGVWAFGQRYLRHTPSGIRDLAVLGSLPLLGLALARAAHAVSATGVLAGSAAPRYAVPVAATSIVAAVLFGAEGAALVATAVSLLAGLALESDLRATIYVFLGSVAAAGLLRQPQRRTDLLRAGAGAALTQLALVAAFALFDAGDPSASQGFPRHAVEAAAGGIAAGALALALLPLYEGFGYLTNFKLLELASLGSPLLKDLSVEAPGTYHHSVVVGSLAEAAAEAVGANPLFARVACYYHDIGKMKKPQYFIENRQAGEPNLHDRLTPSMSALVVESHVKDGIEMGLANGLPKAIVDVIPQHHGTRLISFFYNKAKKQADADPTSAEVFESDFRYPGPKPQTREAGIIMLADGVEASTRTITEATPARVHAMVQKVFSLVQTDGQLDECDLSLRDLSTIGSAFEKVLLGMHHRRVAYPSTAEIAGVISLPNRRTARAEEDEIEE